MSAVESREESEDQNPATNDDADKGDDRPAHDVYVPPICSGPGQGQHQEAEYHDHHSDDRQNCCYKSNLRPRLVQVSEVRCNRLDGRHHVSDEEVAYLRNGIDRCDAVEQRYPTRSRDIAPVVGYHEEVGDGLGEAGGVFADGGEHGAGVGEIRVVGNEGQQAGDLCTDLVKGEGQQQMVGMGEVGLDGSEDVAWRQPGSPRDQLHQRSHLVGRTTLGIHNRVQHVDDVVDHGDTYPVSNHTLFGEHRSGTVEDPLAGV